MERTEQQALNVFATLVVQKHKSYDARDRSTVLQYSLVARPNK